MIFDLEENDSIQRNENICRIFSKTMYMEHVGTGIKRMKDEMRRYGLPEPEFMESGEFFKVIFRVDDKTKNFNGRQIFLNMSRDNITTQEYIDLFDISRNTDIKDLNELIEKDCTDNIYLILKLSYDRQNVHGCIN